MQPMQPMQRRTVFGFVICLLLTACGGGGAAPLSPEPSPGPSPFPAATRPDLGPNADLRGWVPFPADDPWNTRVDGAEVDPASDRLIASIGAATRLHPDFGASWNGGPFGIPYVVVAGTEPRVPMTFGYADESDPGPYPFPADAPIEGGPTSSGDRHVLAIDRDAWTLWETWSTYPRPDPARNGWTAGSGAFFDLTTGAARPAGWTSADAAGLPVFPGLVRYDEVVGRGEILHALRFTVTATRRAYVAPATHWASSDRSVDRPPMGMRVRLKASFDVASFPPQARVILTCLQRYGMFVADNGGDWFLSGAPDARWDDDDLHRLKTVAGGAFEVVRMGAVTSD